MQLENDDDDDDVASDDGDAVLFVSRAADMTGSPYPSLEATDDKDVRIWRFDGRAVFWKSLIAPSQLVRWVGTSMGCFA